MLGIFGGQVPPCPPVPPPLTIRAQKVFSGAKARVDHWSFLTEQALGKPGNNILIGTGGVVANWAPTRKRFCKSDGLVRLFHPQVHQGPENCGILWPWLLHQKVQAKKKSAGQPGCPVISIMSLSPYVMFNSSALAPLRLYKDLECHKVHNYATSDSCCNGGLLAILL